MPDKYILQEFFVTAQNIKDIIWIHPISPSGQQTQDSLHKLFTVVLFKVLVQRVYHPGDVRSKADVSGFSVNEGSLISSSEIFLFLMLTNIPEQNIVYNWSKIWFAMSIFPKHVLGWNLEIKKKRRQQQRFDLSDIIMKLEKTG